MMIQSTIKLEVWLVVILLPFVGCAKKSLDERLMSEEHYEAMSEIDSLDSQAKRELTLKIIPHLKTNMWTTALNVIEKIGPDAKDAVPALSDLLLRVESKDWVYSEKVLDILSSMGPNAADSVPTLTQLIESHSSQPGGLVVQGCFRTLVKIGAPAVSGLNNLLNNQNRYIQEDAQEAIAKINAQ